jgi:hypothetical protein
LKEHQSLKTEFPTLRLRPVMAESVSSGNLLFAVVRQYCADPVRTAARAKHETIKGSKCTTAVDLKVGVGDTVRI